MAYLSYTDLVQRCIVRLRQVAGVTTQAYSEASIALLIEECYEQCRVLRWWDHLTTWQTRTLDGSSGKVTSPFIGVREGMRDVQGVFLSGHTTSLSLISQHVNPSRYTGTTPRAVEALNAADDPTGGYLFRVWPIASTGDVAVRVRSDPADLFTNPVVKVPFDATALVNGACMKYAVMDGTNPGSVIEFDRAYNERVMQLQKMHDSRPLEMDGRSNIHYNEWQEDWR